MLRISRTDPEPRRRALRLEGRLIGEWVDLLAATCHAELGKRKHVVLDLSGVTYVSRAGVSLLCGLRELGVEWEHLPAFLKELTGDA